MVVAHQVGSDSKQPRLHRGLATESRRRAVCLEKRHLHEVVGIRGGREPRDEAIDVELKAIVERTERRLVSLGDCRDERTVRQLFRASLDAAERKQLALAHRSSKRSPSANETYATGPNCESLRSAAASAHRSANAAT